MSEYNAGDKFIVEIEEGHNGYYKIKELALCVPKEALDSMGQLVQGVDEYSRTKGQEEAWELIRKIRSHPDHGGIPAADLIKIFGSSYINDIVLGNTYQEAAAKVEAWEQEKEPKLTAKERAFCEVMGSGYIARDLNGGLLVVYGEEPHKRRGKWEIDKDIYKCISANYFPFIKWSDEEAWSVEALLTLEVE